MAAWNTQIFIFGWCENILVGISFSKLFFLSFHPNGKMFIPADLTH